jgi:hypothetical protein
VALAAPEGAPAGAAALATWLRLAAMRQLRWNVNYNVKPREISAAQVQCPRFFRYLSVNTSDLKRIDQNSSPAG